ncbi:LexA family protein [Methylophilus medardicus]|uniref:Peptidase S24 n=1 Tax=Methylophilus medardicus TaxID=2588534 RepID=A0A5B8CTW0_9PROT|nr:S24 family peptidase [Methylophilus medardicus]QDC44768.1 peptidase S24 [Methylophilus medardicus]QDC49775.1 peptidase S24 [Methylophilus medardicus]QDC53480.1 peptidase S24 [Methylophilus medardicus]
MKNDNRKITTRKPGSGRKVGSGTFREETSVIRVPNSQKPVIIDFLESYAKKQRQAEQKDNLDAVDEFSEPVLGLPSLSLPLYQSKVPAGLPAPADNDVEEQIDMYEYLIRDGNDTFFITIQGESMIEAGLMPGDKAIVVKGKQASLGDIVLAMIDGEFTVKTLSKQPNGLPKLLPENSSGKYAPILITKQMEFEITGVVTGSFRRFK